MAHELPRPLPLPLPLAVPPAFLLHSSALFPGAAASSLPERMVSHLYGTRAAAPSFTP